MVKSTIVGITPAAHGASHIHGGSDPVTGDVRIDRIGQYSGANILDGNCVGTTWTEWNLSGVVGAKRSLIQLRLENKAVAVAVFSFRPSGDTDDYYDVNAVASTANAHLVAVVGNVVIVWVLTSNTGRIEYYANGIRNVKADIMGYINLE